MTQPDGELEQQLAYLATELLGWKHRHFNPDAFTSSWWWWKPSRRFGNPLDILTGNGMLEIIEAMKKRDWRSHLYINGDCMAAFQRDADDHEPESAITFAQRTGLTLPEAVARAAYAALQESAK